METTVFAELMFEVVPHWSERIGKYIRETDDSQDQSSGIIVTPSGVVEPPRIVVPDCDGASSTRRIMSTPGIVTTTPGIAGVAMPPPSPTTLTPGGAEPSDPNNAAQFKKALAVAHGTCNLDSKPDSKSRFSSLTSPVVMYDGESQHMLCDLWTALNNKRGGLRKEMMAVKRRQQLAILPPPRPMPEIAMDSDEGEASDKDDEDEDVEHSAEMLRLRLRMEREKMKRMNRRGPPGMAMGGDSLPGMGGLQFKRARMIGGAPGAAPPTPPRSQQGEPSGTSVVDDEKMKALLEVIDENLDKICKVTETVAFIWLKGDPYDGHLKFILGRLKDVSEKIEKSGFVPAKAGSKQCEQKTTSEVTLLAMAPPLPQTPPTTAGTMSPKFEISKKKSDLTMRDAPSLRPSQVVPPMEKQIERKKSTSSSEDTVEHSMESVNPPPLLLREVEKESGKANPFEPDVLDVDADDDEGIVC